MILLIDIGNTRLKWAESNEAYLGEVHYIAHQQADFMTALCAEWRLLLRPSAVKIACVSALNIKDKVASLIAALWPEIRLLNVVTQPVFHGLKNAYKQPECLGVDRWLAMVGAYMEYTLPVCVVDCGTAVTLDVIDVHGQHLGGLIMPGLTLMQQSLMKGTARLNFSDRHYSRGLACDTGAAIYNGLHCAIQGFIDNGLIGDASIILTGGDAERIAVYCESLVWVDKHLVLKGLRA